MQRLQIVVELCRSDPTNQGMYEVPPARFRGRCKEVVDFFLKERLFLWRRTRDHKLVQRQVVLQQRNSHQKYGKESSDGKGAARPKTRWQDIPSPNDLSHPAKERYLPCLTQVTQSNKPTACSSNDRPAHAQSTVPTTLSLAAGYHIQVCARALGYNTCTHVIPEPAAHGNTDDTSTTVLSQGTPPS